VGHACARVVLRPISQIEFTHLAGFLPALYGEFAGAGTA
jgi:hypothetical protein